MDTIQNNPAFLNGMDELAMGLVRKYIDEHYWKYLISSTLPDGKYYELTYNSDKQEWYLDCYVKLENRCLVLD